MKNKLIIESKLDDLSVLFFGEKAFENCLPKKVKSIDFEEVILTWYSDVLNITKRIENENDARTEPVLKFIVNNFINNDDINPKLNLTQYTKLIKNKMLSQEDLTKLFIGNDTPEFLSTSFIGNLHWIIFFAMELKEFFCRRVGGGHLILEKLTPAKDTRIEYEGQKWDADVFYAAMKDIEAQRKSGVLLDRDSYRALSNWKRGR